MQSLSSELLAHQRGSQRRPTVQVRGLAHSFGVRRFLWSRYYSGAEPSSPHALGAASDGSLIRARNDAGTLYVQRVASPGPASDYSSWTNLASVTTGAPVALCARTGEVILAFVDNGGLTIRVRSSGDNGVTWSAAVAVVTEAVSIGSLAIAFRPDGDACLFYTLTGTTSLKSLRRTAGAWAAAGTNWSRAASVASLSGLAACHDGADFSLVLTGTAAAGGGPRAWGVRMGDGLLPANSWSALTEITEADAASTTSFTAPAILALDGDLHGAFVAAEAGPIAANRVMYGHPPHLTDVNTTWSEPAPHEATAQEGLTLAASSDGAWASTPSGVWHAPTPAPDLLSSRVLRCTARVALESARCTVELDNADGALSALPSAAFPATLTGGTIELAAGYFGGAGGAAEYGPPLRFAIDAIREDAHDGRRTVVIEGSGPWERAERWRAPQAWQVSPGVLARNQVFERVAGRAGIAYATGGRSPSSDWSSGQPAFAVLPGESAASALHRLLAVVSDGVRADGDAFVLTGCGPGDASDFAYGPDDHPIASLELLDDPPSANRVRVHGPDRYAEASDAASIAAHGERLLQLRNLDATTDAKAAAMATAALRRAQWSTPRGRLMAPCNVGQQLLDVVTVTHPSLGITARAFRVVGCGWDYDRAGARPRLDSLLELGGL